MDWRKSSVSKDGTLVVPSNWLFTHYYDALTRIIHEASSENADLLASCSVFEEPRPRRTARVRLRPRTFENTAPDGISTPSARTFMNNAG